MEKKDQRKVANGIKAGEAEKKPTLISSLIATFCSKCRSCNRDLYTQIEEVEEVKEAKTSSK